MADIKIRLAAVRVNAEMTMEEWAKALGVNKDTVLNWEKGRTVPKLTTARTMAKLSGIPVDYFFLPQNDDEVVSTETTA